MARGRVATREVAASVDTAVREEGGVLEVLVEVSTGSVQTAAVVAEARSRL